MPSTTAVQAKPKPIPIEKPEERPARARLITGVQECIADLVGDLITRGGNRRNIRLLLTAVLDHQYRRFYFAPTDDADKLKAHADKWVEQHISGWDDDLTVSIRMRKVWPRSERPTPKTVSEKIRENTREDLETSFDQFTTEADPEEIALLLEILGDRDRATWVKETAREIGIATSFDRAVNGYGHNYIRVPEAIRGDVETYANALLKTMAREEA